MAVLTRISSIVCRRTFWSAALLLGILISWTAHSQEEGEPPAKPAVLAPTVTSQVERGPTPEEIEDLELAREQDLELFIRRNGDFREVVDGMVQRVYKMRRNYIDESYQDRIRAEEALAEKTRKSAIQYFVEFLKKYPSDPVYTPDAMYRLAELYYDDSFIRYQEELEAYALAEEQGRAKDMDLPQKELDRTIAILKDLINNYPSYRSIDGAYYVLGYCLNETGAEEEARLAWLNIVCANKYRYDSMEFAAKKASDGTDQPTRPSASLTIDGLEASEPIGFVDPFAGCKPVTDNSRFFFESWWLIGNYHFDYDTSRDGVETSIAAYQKLVEDPKHRFYDKGLYKLAWSYFKADMYPEAIKTFAMVVDFSDKQTGNRGTGMRPEAIQYLAVCFFENWNLDDMTPDPELGFRRLQDPSLMPQDRPWTVEVYERLGDIYADNEKNEEAIRVWKLVLERWPLYLNAPFIQEKVALTYNKLREFEKEINERGKLDNYGPDSEWWEANAEHPVEQNEVAKMARDALLEAAFNRHRTAQALRQRGLAAQDGELLERALNEYNLAAQAYRKFIEQNPDTPDAYDINFYLAETLFWSGQHAAAKVEYASVRDSNLDAKHRAESAYMVIVCLEEMLKKEVTGGSVAIRTERPELTGDPPAPAPIPIPALVLELMNEKEYFITNNADHEEAAKFMYQSAQNYYRYGHWEEAKLRYTNLYETYCGKDPMAYVSWQAMMNMAVDMDNLDEKERLALLQQQRDCSAEGIQDLIGDDAQAIDIETVLGDVAMQRALDAFKTCLDGKDPEVCSSAGDSLVAAVGQAPEHPAADAALHNAALAYEVGQRFDSAMKVYGRIVEEYPDSKFVGKCLFQQASAANNFFEYDKALENYKILADEDRFKDYENRTLSVYNAAFILTNLQSYTHAIPYWERYSREETDVTKSVEAAFKAADMLFKARKWRAAIDAYDNFIRRNERREGAGPFVVKASYRIGKSYEKLNQKRKLPDVWTKTRRYYDTLVNSPGSMSAEYAAQSHFLIIEQDMDKFKNFKIAGSQNVIDKKIKEGAEKVKSLESRYREIQKYRRPEWSLAAEFRIGYTYEIYAKAILNIPLPPLDKDTQRLLKQLPKEDRELVMIEYEDKFRAAMEEFVASAEEKAQAEYRIAVDLARQGNISNEWTLMALERMNAYDPDNYPRQHNGVAEMEQGTFAAPPWAAGVEQ